MPNALSLGDAGPLPVTHCGHRDVEDFMALEEWVRTRYPGISEGSVEETVDVYWLATAPQTPCRSTTT